MSFWHSPSELHILDTIAVEYGEQWRDRTVSATFQEQRTSKRRRLELSGKVGWLFVLAKILWACQECLVDKQDDTIQTNELLHTRKIF